MTIYATATIAVNVYVQLDRNHGIRLSTEDNRVLIVDFALDNAHIRLSSVDMNVVSTLTQ